MNNFNRQLFYKEKNYVPEIEDENLKSFFEKTSNKYNKSSDDEDNNFNDENKKYEKITKSSLDYFFEEKKKIRRKMKNTEFNEPKLKESLEFHLELLKEMNNLEINRSFNLTKYHLKIISEFSEKKPFKIVELDKNIGSALISNELYDTLVFKSLNDKNVYSNFKENPMNNIKMNIESKLVESLNNSHISKKLFNNLINLGSRLGSFRILPKILKEKFDTRPIINYRDHLITNLCLFIEFILRPYVRKSDSFIMDSQNLIQKLEKMKFPRDSHITTGDFKSLFSNINHKDCLNLLTEFMTDKLKSKEIKISGFRNILNLILENNYFTFCDKYFKQNLGVAMGCICGPTIANIFVYIYEKKWITIHKPLAYFRFVDDVLLITRDLLCLESLKNAFGSLTLNLVISKKQIFLDLEIELDNITCKIVFYAYFKPTNTFSYLYIESNHPTHIFKNLIKALFIRIRRICTFLSDYLYFSNIISNRLVKRGYEKSLIWKNQTMVANIKRESLLEYKPKNQKIDFEKSFIFKYEFNKNISNFKEVVKKAFNSFKEKNPRYKNHNLFLINKMQNNLSSILIHNFRYPKIYKNKYKRCKIRNCKTCEFSNNRTFINLTNNFILPISENTSCDSENVIYVIFCSFCNTFYFGQSNCLKDRIYNHIYDIKTFKYPFKEFKSVAVHFNLKYHDYKKHFSFFVLRKNIENLDNRLIIESFLINLSKKLDVKLMNDHIPELKDYYSTNNLKINK